MKIKEEKFNLEVYREVLPLLEAHKEELTIFDVELKPDLVRYLNGSTLNQMAFFSARDNGKLVGYVVYFLYYHPHYKDTYVAQQDILYLHKDYRKGLMGLKLIKYSEKELKEREVSLILQSSKVHKSIESLFTFMKYKECDKIYAKEI